MLRLHYSKGSSENGMDNLDIDADSKQFLIKLNDNIYAMMGSKHVDSEKLASRMCMSRSQLYRRIVSITGMNTSAYIAEVRMSLAKRLLLADISMPVSTIAIKCGYEDMAYFSRIFKAVTGMTPTQYRRNN